MGFLFLFLCQPHLFRDHWQQLPLLLLTWLHRPGLLVQQHHPLLLGRLAMINVLNSFNTCAMYGADMVYWSNFFYKPPTSPPDEQPVDECG